MTGSMELTELEIQRVCAVLEREAWKCEKRHIGRFPFPTNVYLAPYRGDKPPGQGEFVRVHCHDLSTGGFSFYAKTEPDFRFAVVRMGHAPDSITLLVCIVHSVPYNRETKEYLVGCQFLRKVAAPA